METIKDKFVSHIRLLQDLICNAITAADGVAGFREDIWERPGGGGGRTRVLQNGSVFEKAGVNTSAVEGVVTPVMQQQLNIRGAHFFATGLSLVLHPYNPFVPTVHANWRYFELYDDQQQLTDSWFGGGTDLTPYYLFEEDAIHFHSTLKNSCDNFDQSFYPRFKKQCDEYFVNKHRGNEARGHRWNLFDYARPGQDLSADQWLAFVISSSQAFLPAYLPLVEKRKGVTFAAEHKYWQEIRRGRYVEFNLVHDRGTIFGLKTNGRTESILMSLPPTVRFDYDYQPAPGSEEEKLLIACKEPVEWIK